MNRRFLTALIAFSCTVCVVFACSVPTAFAVQDGAATPGGPMQPTREIVPHLTVRGMAELEKPADQLRLQIGVVTEDADAQNAMRANSERMRAVVQALQNAGLTEREYQTGRFNVQPRWSSRPPRADAEWRPHIVGYIVTNTVQVKTRKLDLAGRLIESANRAGANSIDSIQFDLADPRVHRAEAIAEATANARSDAQALAEAAGLRLVRVLSISLDDAHPVRPPMMYERAVAMSMDTAEPPIQPGDVTVRASVNIVYEVGPANGNDN